jgi:hypothetical protein
MKRQRFYLIEKLIYFDLFLFNAVCWVNTTLTGTFCINIIWVQDSVGLLCRNLHLSSMLFHVLTFNTEDRYQANALALSRWGISQFQLAFIGKFSFSYLSRK